MCNVLNPRHFFWGVGGASQTAHGACLSKALATLSEISGLLFNVVTGHRASK